MIRKQELIELINWFGGYVRFDKYIMYRKSPHEPSIFFNYVSIKSIDEIPEEAINTIVQRLIIMKLKKQGKI